MSPMYYSYSSTPTKLPDICKTAPYKFPELCTGVNPPSGTTKPNDVLKTILGPPKPNNYDDASKLWFSTKGNSSIKAENKASQLVKGMDSDRLFPVTKATTHEVDTGDFDIQKYLPILLLGGGAVVMMMFMFMS